MSTLFRSRLLLRTSGCKQTLTQKDLYVGGILSGCSEGDEDAHRQDFMSCLRVGGKTELGGCHRGRPEQALGDKSDGRPPSPVHTLLNMGLGEVGETATLHSSTWDEETRPEGDEASAVLG